MNSRRLFDLTTMAWHAERWGREVVVVTVALDQKLPFSSHSWAWAKDTRSRMLPSKTYGTKKNVYIISSPDLWKSCPAAKKCSLHFIGRVTNFTSRTFFAKISHTLTAPSAPEFPDVSGKTVGCKQPMRSWEINTSQKMPLSRQLQLRGLFFLERFDPKICNIMTCYAIMEYLILFLTILSSVILKMFRSQRHPSHNSQTT